VIRSAQRLRQVSFYLGNAFYLAVFERQYLSGEQALDILMVEVNRAPNGFSFRRPVSGVRCEASGL
jgi:hypothetical protein